MDHVQVFLSEYGYLAVFSALALGIVGLPVPDELLMMVAGYMTKLHVLQFHYTLLFSFAGAMSGMLFSYWMGMKVGRPFLDRYGKWVGLKPHRVDRVSGWMERYGPLTIIFGYFVPGLRHATCYLSGISDMSLQKFSLYASTGALTWCLIFILLGRMFG